MEIALLGVNLCGNNASLGGKTAACAYPYGIQMIYFAFLVFFNYSSLLFMMYFNINGS